MQCPDCGSHRTKWIWQYANWKCQDCGAMWDPKYQIPDGA